MANALAEDPEYSVLVVDDEPQVRQSLRTRFQLEGFKVLDADGGDAAYAVVEKQHPDLVITDIRMPGGSGTNLLKRLSTMKNDRPVVMCITGFSDLQVHEAFDLGAFAVFQKPFDIRAVVHASRRFLKMRSEQASLAETLARFDNELRQILGAVNGGVMPADGGNLSMADLRMVVGMILHEVNGPLSVAAMSSVQVVSTLETQPERTGAALRLAKVVRNNCDRLVKISHALKLLFAAQRAEASTRFSLDDVAREAMAQVLQVNDAWLPDLRLSSDGPSHFVCGVRQQIVQLVRNLLDNAVYAAKQTGQRRIDIVIEVKNGNHRLAVSDLGPGVPEDAQAAIFEPYFSTKGKDGTGMGLPLCRRIAAAHNGSLLLEPTPVGARFVLLLAAVP